MRKDIVQVPKFQRDAYRAMMNVKDAAWVLALDPLEDSGGPYHIKAFRSKAVEVYAALRDHLGVGFSVKPGSPVLPARSRWRL